MTVNDIANEASDHVRMRMEKSGDLLAWLAGELEARVEKREEGRASCRVDRLFMQLSRVFELVRLAIDQSHANKDLGMAWILLEQSRQQLGHAANGATLIGGEPRIGREQLEYEQEALVHIGVFLQRELMPWPHDAGIVVEFGKGLDEGHEGPGEGLAEELGGLPDFRPDTALEMMPLQFLANAAMTYCAGEVVQDLDRRVMQMAFGEFVWKILEEATELLEFWANQAGEGKIEALLETGIEVAFLVSGAFPPSEEIFKGPAGLPDGAE